MQSQMQAKTLTSKLRSHFSGHKRKQLQQTAIDKIGGGGARAARSIRIETYTTFLVASQRKFAAGNLDRPLEDHFQPKRHQKPMTPNEGDF